MRNQYSKETLLSMLDAIEKEEENTQRIKKRKANFSKQIVLFVILLNIIFTVSILYVFLKTGSEPMTLVGAFFAFTTVELWSLSKIKRSEIEEKANEY